MLSKIIFENCYNLFLIIIIIIKKKKESGSQSHGENSK